MSSNLAAAFWIAPLAPLHAQVVIGDRIACSTCSIEVVGTAVLRSSDSIGFLFNSRVAVDSRGRYVVAPTFTPGQIALFDARGEFIRAHTRPGSGPGEIPGNIEWLSVTPPDSIDVLSHATLLRLPADLRSSGRSQLLPTRPQQLLSLESGEVLAQFPLRVAGVGTRLIHRVDPNGIIRASLEENDPDERQPWARLRVIALAGSGNTVWAAPLNRYRLRLLDLDGRVLFSLAREAPWFPPWNDDEQGGPRQTRPHPRIRGIADLGDQLWIFLNVADANWSPRPERAGEAPVVPGGESMANVFDTVVEVIDARSRQVIARRRFDDVILPIGNSGLAYSHQERADGDVDLRIYKLNLSQTRR